MSKLFTVLLAINRPPALLPFSVDSVLRQTVGDFELFIICDGAPEATVETAKSLAEQDDRITVFPFKKDMMWGETHLATALEQANGKYVAHIEDDDIWLPNHLAVLEDLLSRVDFGNTQAARVHMDGKIRIMPSDIGNKEFRQLSVKDRFNRVAFSVCGYRLDAYRKLSEGWTNTPVGPIWVDLYMWRKFYTHPKLRFGSSPAITAIILADCTRPGATLEERAEETRKWADKIKAPDSGEWLAAAGMRALRDRYVKLELFQIQTEAAKEKAEEQRDNARQRANELRERVTQQRRKLIEVRKKKKDIYNRVPGFLRKILGIRRK